MGVKGLSGTDESRCIECRWNRGQMSSTGYRPVVSPPPSFLPSLGLPCFPEERAGRLALYHLSLMSAQERDEICRFCCSGIHSDLQQPPSCAFISLARSRVSGTSNRSGEPLPSLPSNFQLALLRPSQPFLAGQSRGSAREGGLSCFSARKA